jgi:hypothetical protein
MSRCGQNDETPVIGVKKDEVKQIRPIRTLGRDRVFCSSRPGPPQPQSKPFEGILRIRPRGRSVARRLQPAAPSNGRAAGPTVI